MSTTPGVFAGDDQTHAIIGAALEVHQRLGHGFLEAVYQEALQIELTERLVPFQREVDIPILYRDRQLACGYRADFVCYGEVLVELKAIRQITDIERAQVIHYLRATGLTRALLLNFGASSLEHKRLLKNPNRSAKSV